MKTIALNDFVVRPSRSLYGANIALQHIAEFYEKFPADDIYMIDIPKDVILLDVLASDDTNLYHKYGIFFSNVDFSVYDRERVMISIEEKDIENVFKFIPDYFTADTLFTVLFKTNKNREEISSIQMSIITDLIEKYPNVSIANTELRPKTFYNYDSGLSEYTVKEIPLYLGRGIDIFDSLHKMKIIKDAIDQALAIPDYENGKRTIIKIGKDESPEIPAVSCYLAAILTAAYGKNVYVSTASRDLFNKYLVSLNSRENMFLSEYLDSVKNPLGFGIFLKGYPSIFLRGNDIKQYDTPIRITIHSTLFDSESRDCNNIKIESNDLLLSEIDILKIEDVFELDNDDNLQNLDALDQLLYKFEKSLRKLDVEKNIRYLSETESLDCSNVLLFRYNNEIRFGYVSHIQGTITYVARLINKEQGSIVYKMDVNDYKYLTNGSYFEDGDDIFKGLTKKSPEIAKLYEGAKVKREYPERIWAIVATAIHHNDSKLGKNDIVSSVQIGLYYPHSSTMRKAGIKEKVLGYFNANSLREERFLSFYGGPHLMRGSSLKVQPKVWR